MPYLFDSAIAAAATEYLTFNQSKAALKLRQVFASADKDFLPVSVQVKIGEQWRDIDADNLAMTKVAMKLDVEIDDQFRVEFGNLDVGTAYWALCYVQPVKVVRIHARRTRY
jgi:hypothetical protein